MGTDDALVILALVAAAYEAVAHFTKEKVPYITSVINRFPWIARVALVGGAAVVSLDHFKVWNLL